MSSIWNDGWRCPECAYEFTPERAEANDMEDDIDWSAPLSNPLLCGICHPRSPRKCVPVGRNFEWNEDFTERRYEDGTVVDPQAVLEARRAG